MLAHKHAIREKLPKIYSQDLLNNIFQHPYTKIEFVTRDIKVGRLTATKYLDQMVQIGILRKVKLGRDNFYINHDLYNLIRTAE